MAVTEYLGAVKLFAGTFAIKGYAFAAGQLMSIQQNTALFALLGTYYGGNGTSTFQLPDLRSRLPVGQGQGPGLSFYTIGEFAGYENVTLNIAEVPPHTHQMYASTSSGVTNAPGSNVLAGNLASTDGAFYTHSTQQGFAPELMNPNALQVQGGNQPHNNIQPCMGINYIIALVGVFPTQN
jgi:microcystin-dependent protein